MTSVLRMSLSDFGAGILVVRFDRVLEGGVWYPRLVSLLLTRRLAMIRLRVPDGSLGVEL